MSLLAPLEKRALAWLALRTPPSIHPDHLTLLGLASLLGAGLCYWYASRNRWALIGVIVFLGFNWLGDSLDGTLARVRNRQRPRYGFYVDHMVDAFGTAALLAGLSQSGYMNERLAMMLLIAYFLISIEVYLATYTLGTFHLSFWVFSPTEIRVLLAVGNLVLLVRPWVRIGDIQYRLFDVGGLVAFASMIIMVLVATSRHTAALYRAERLP